MKRRVNEGGRPRERLPACRQVGRFQIKGPCVMEGYKDHPVANAESFVGDGWFDSGDLGFVHKGCGPGTREPPHATTPSQ